MPRATGGDAIKNYFLNYDECLSNDFVLSAGRPQASSCCARTSTTGRSPSSTPACAPTSASACAACASTSSGDEVFLANYSDGLVDLRSRQAYVDDFQRARQDRLLPQRARRRRPSTSSTPTPSNHVQRAGVRRRLAAAHQRRLLRAAQGDLRLHEPGRGAGGPAVPAPDGEAKLVAVPYDGFWRNMDTFRDKIELDELVSRGRAPWQLWM